MASKKIESHSSGLNNKRIQILLTEIDALALNASNGLHISSIHQYYNAVEQLYLNVKDVFVNKKHVQQIDGVRERYHFVYDLVLNNPSTQHSKSLRYLSRLVRKYNSNIITAMQSDLEYFFRMGIRESKGLMNIKYYENQEYDEVDTDEIRQEMEGE